ncbi:TonB-dependent receptor [Sphingomonas sp. AX6]|uniref:TonB-dependent receptor n=1 Tax=Sphingomonas sp. AX6 TaxID=2653171 RepID=UPI0012EF459E|nr:TonB-dependent receptor [Sphingomonas sp. AX6]VXC85289.1 TonB-dependent receptor [Sphingomonas sp. AX6]
MLKESAGRARIMTTASWGVMGLLLAFGGEAAAQTTTGQNAEIPQTSQVEDLGQEEGEVVVTGSRASQQSSNNRKRNARTATDSIVADDIGSFPDRNVNEAISRIPGVALGRNEFGEGESVAVRGNGPDLTRVELDGIGVQSTTALALGTDGARSADLRELPAELIKSVDVVKGSTADMTEGSLGGTIKIQTRTGLDFAKPYFSFRAGAQQNSLGRDWTPDFNAVASRKFFGDRLGVIVSGNYSKIQNDGHGYENTTSGNRGYSRLFDFDQSPDKTFQYNLDTLNGDLADVLYANSAETPRTLLTKAAGAQTKAQCFDLFPHNPTASTAQRGQRILEQQSCLNQWNDYTPSLIRNFMNTQTDERYSGDIRFDYRLTDQITLFAKGAFANRYVQDQNRSRTPITLFSQNAAGTFVDSLAPEYPRRRTVAPNSPAGYFLFDPNFGLNNVGNNATLGNVLNVVPGSVVVDAAHNVTAMTLTNNSVSIDQIENIIDSKTYYLQGGGEYRGDRIDIDAMVGMTRATSTRGDMRTSRTYNYGNADLVLQPNGLWDIQLPDNYDDSNPDNFVQLTAPRCLDARLSPPTCIGQNAVLAGPNGPATPAYTVGQMPLTTPTVAVQYSPRAGESSERLAKLDFTYRTDDLLPFITRVKVGAQYRNAKTASWGAGGYTVSGAVGTFGQPGYIPAVIVPTANVRGSLRACQPTAGSSAPGGLSCNYGFVPSTNPLNARSGVDTLTPEELRALLAKTIEPSQSEYFGDLPNRGSLPPAWNGIRTDQLFAELGASQFMNFDCLKTCVGSDGQTYDQPVGRTNETIFNLYGMVDFEQQLPYGLLFNGNAGVRAVHTKVDASALLTITNIRTTATFNPLDPNNPSGISSQAFSDNTSVKADSTDFLPSVNLNLWAFDEAVVLRLYGAKTVARPRVTQLIPAGSCTIDERDLLDGGEENFGCGGRVGNPGLDPYTAWSYNASLEWYPNPDTVFSAAYGKLDVKIGAPIGVTITGTPFGGSDRTDPLTGRPLSELEFNYPTFENGPGYKRDIFEFQAKTAFTFLPSFLQYTGIDGNLSVIQSSATQGTQDPLTGDVMLPPDESKYYMNASLWYDDGKLNMRVAYQKRTATFNCITPCGGNTTDINYPSEGLTNVRLVGPGYNPGVPRFTDGSTFIDAKISYNINRNFQVYVEGRNVRREFQTASTGGYTDFADGTPKIMRLNYGGRRILVGARVQFGGTR